MARLRPHGTKEQQDSLRSRTESLLSSAPASHPNAQSRALRDALARCAGHGSEAGTESEDDAPPAKRARVDPSQSQGHAAETNDTANDTAHTIAPGDLYDAKDEELLGMWGDEDGDDNDLELSLSSFSDTASAAAARVASSSKSFEAAKASSSSSSSSSSSVIFRDDPEYSRVSGAGNPAVYGKREGSILKNPYRPTATGDGWERRVDKETEKGTEKEKEMARDAAPKRSRLSFAPMSSMELIRTFSSREAPIVLSGGTPEPVNDREASPEPSEPDHPRLTAAEARAREAKEEKGLKERLQQVRKLFKKPGFRKSSRLPEPVRYSDGLVVRRRYVPPRLTYIPSGAAPPATPHGGPGKTNFCREEAARCGRVPTVRFRSFHEAPPAPHFDQTVAWAGFDPRHKGVPLAVPRAGQPLQPPPPQAASPAFSASPHAAAARYPPPNGPSYPGDGRPHAAAAGYSSNGSASPYRAVAPMHPYQGRPPPPHHGSGAPMHGDTGGSTVQGVQRTWPMTVDRTRIPWALPLEAIPPAYNKPNRRHPCNFYSTVVGCQRGNHCAYIHDPYYVPPRPPRGWEDALRQRQGYSM